LAVADTIEPVELAAPAMAALGELAASAQATDEVRPIYLRAPDAVPMAI
jgi:hypothetical protein